MLTGYVIPMLAGLGPALARRIVQRFGAETLTVIEQLTYLMFIKILDDNETRKESNAALFGMEVEDPIFDADHQNCRWHKDRSRRDQNSP